ncbi:MAG TPA: hypothetical protein VK658_15130 [Chryseolinea sp.]|nr:hypothetical protein [Chryseolinea sp.]
MAKNKFKVYDPETDGLKFINEREIELFQLLHDSSEVRFVRILQEHFDKFENKLECLDRLDEITSYLSKRIRAFQSDRKANYFLTRPRALEIIIDILETSRIQNSSKTAVVDRKIFIEDQLIPAIAKGLGPHFKNPMNLEKVLSGSDQKFEKLIFKKDAKMLVGTFTTLKNCQILKNPIAEIVEWLVYRFQSTYRGRAVNLKPGSVKNYLEKNNNPSSNPIIAIEDLSRNWSKETANRH